MHIITCRNSLGGLFAFSSIKPGRRGKGVISRQWVSEDWQEVFTKNYEFVEKVAALASVLEQIQ
jgi:hypothetical protein